MAVTIRATAIAQKHLAIIGGGPKAVAIAVRAEMLRRGGHSHPRITVFEPGQIANNWIGSASGYTDGEQQLCTLAERDLGHPYSETFPTLMNPSDFSRQTHNAFSWTAFRLSQGDLGDWVERGRQRPTHRDFARYLVWAWSQCGPGVAHLEPGKVTKVEQIPSGWMITSDRAAVQHGPFDGVVVTGPGPARKTPNAAAVDPQRLFNGQDFWHRLPDVRALLAAMRVPVKEADDEGIVILGGGGTAAAILGWLLENGARDIPITMIAGSQAALHLRAENVFENRLFTDVERWKSLSPKVRFDFVDRLNRGVVWDAVMQRVERAVNLKVVEGYGKALSQSSSTHPIVVHHSGYDAAVPLEPAHIQSPPQLSPLEQVFAGMVIDASGFEAEWWLNLFSDFVPGSLGNDPLKELKFKMTENLELDLPPLWTSRYPVHVPNLSAFHGPGLGNLMSLGAMAERVLRPYC